MVAAAEGRNSIPVDLDPRTHLLILGWERAAGQIWLRDRIDEPSVSLAAPGGTSLGPGTPVDLAFGRPR